MNTTAQTRITKLESILPATWALPAVLAVNTFALLALDQLGGIPSWIKTATAVFLSF
ncbi:MAG TPA: hypothetical protein VII75_00660 [Thermoanaerobaculia bacterium]|nr:hypothetical protein [Thermoanaerobaculia bacterium]